MKDPLCTGWCEQRRMPLGCGQNVCPPNTRNATPHSVIVSTNEGFSLRVAEELLREVAGSGVELEDPRLRYVTVQISRETWERVRAYLPGEETKP